MCLIFLRLPFGGSKEIVGEQEIQTVQEQGESREAGGLGKNQQVVETDHGSETNHEVSSGWWWKPMETLVDLGWLVGLEFGEERSP